MKLKLKLNVINIISLIVLTLLFGLFSAKNAFAANFQLSGKVTDAANNPIANTAITVTDPNSQATIGTTTTDTNGNYALSVPQGTYTVTATPPTSSGFQSATVTNQNISSDTVLNFTLVPIPTGVTLSGHVTDRAGSGVSGAHVLLGQGADAFTDASGMYSVHIAPGSYKLEIVHSGTSLLPDGLDLMSSNALSITQDTTLDLQLPSALVTAQVQDPSHNPVVNALVNMDTGGGNISLQTTQGSLQFNILQCSSFNNTYYTDGSGKVTIATCPTNVTISVTPPSGSTLLNASVTQSITQDTTVPITLANGAVTLSGHVTDRAGSGVSGVKLTLGNNDANVYTDTNGMYSVHIAPGSYKLEVAGMGTSRLPDIFDLKSSNALSITQDTTLDLQLPGALVTAQVQDPSHNPVVNALVNVNDNDSSISLQTTQGSLQFDILQANSFNNTHYTDSVGKVTIATLPGNTAIYVTPPTGSNLLDASVTQSITQDTTVPITLANGAVTLSGHVTDRAGSGVSGAHVLLGQGADAFTDASGMYSVHIAPGSYKLEIVHSGTSLLPDGLDLMSSNALSITQDTTLDLQLPSALVTAQVQDPSHNPVVNALVNMDTGGGNISLQTTQGSLQFNILQCSSFNNTYYTDGSGKVTIATCPTNVTISVTPPTGSNLLPFSTTVTVTTDTTQVLSLQLQNQPPTVGIITLSTNPTQINTSITADATFTDQNTADTHTASWNWGDGNTSSCLPNSSQCTLTESNGSGSVSGTHTYIQAGIYTITLSVTDNHGGQGTSTFQYMVVYNPGGGFLTGAGNYNSQAGWDMQNTQATGKVILGINAQYTTGNTPTGQSKINFNAGNIDFKSTSYQWLVVSGAKATLKGNGTVNGSGNYTFLISGIDGSQTGGPNLIRVKITDSSNNVIYDTQSGAPDTADPTTALSSGSIKVH